MYMHKNRAHPYQQNTYTRYARTSTHVLNAHTKEQHTAAKHKTRDTLILTVLEATATPPRGKFMSCTALHVFESLS